MTATGTPVARPPGVQQGSSSIAKKIAMAVSGVILLGFVIVHFLGNLKVYQGAEAFNHYAEGLREVGAPFFARGQLLWVARVVLLLAVSVHIGAAIQLVQQSRRARPVGYHRFDSLAFSYASRTMVWGGILILAFVVYHLLHLTLGVPGVHPDFIAGDAYHNFISGFRAWPVAVAYMAAMVPLGLHLYHGIWSALQTLGAGDPGASRLRRPIAAVIAGAVALGNMSFPIAVLTGILR